MAYAEPKPTLDSDIEAFRHKHPLDYRDERIVAECDQGHIVRSIVCSEIFSFSEPEVGEITFDVRGIKDALAAGKLPFAMFEADLDAAWVEHVCINNGVEFRAWRR